MTLPAPVDLWAPPDIEPLLVGYLAALMPQSYVATKAPDPRVDSMLILTLGAGSSLNLAQVAASLLVESYAPDDDAAYRQASHAFAYLRTADLGWLSHVTAQFPYAFPDSAGRSRYQFTAQLTVNLQEVTP